MTPSIPSRPSAGKWVLSVSTAFSLVWSPLDLYGSQSVRMNKVQYTSRMDTPKGRILNDPWIKIPNLCYPVMLIKWKVIQQSVNEAKLSYSFCVQETEYMKPDFIGEFHCCHHSWETGAHPFENNTNWELLLFWKNWSSTIGVHRRILSTNTTMLRPGKLCGCHRV